MLKRSIMVALALALASLVPGTPGQASEPAEPALPIRLLYTFDQCHVADCPQVVPDDSRHGNAGTVHTVGGGRLEVVPGRHGLAARLAGAIIRLDTSPDDTAFSPGTRPFVFGASVFMDTAFTEDANLFQRGVFSDVTNQWKLQLDATRQGCVIKGDQGRVLVFAPTDLPGDGRWHEVACVVTPQWIAFVVDGVAHRLPNTAGSVTFTETAKVEIGGRIRPDGTINDPFPKAFDNVFYGLL